MNIDCPKTLIKSIRKSKKNKSRSTKDLVDEFMSYENDSVICDIDAADIKENQSGIETAIDIWLAQRNIKPSQIEDKKYDYFEQKRKVIHCGQYHSDVFHSAPALESIDSTSIKESELATPSQMSKLMARRLRLNTCTSPIKVSA